MKRKAAAFSITLLAYLLLLGHAVVPHHHHHRLPCIHQEHCAEDAGSNRAGHPLQDHQHDSKDYPSTCFISDFIPASLIQAPRDYCWSIKESNTSLVEYLFLNQLQQDVTVLNLTSVVYPEHSSPPLNLRCRTSTGLRAPPAA